MIRIEVDGGSVRECAASGNHFQVAGGLAIAVRGIYYVMSRANAAVAAEFRASVAELFGKDGQVWDTSTVNGSGFCCMAASAEGNIGEGAETGK